MQLADMKRLSIGTKLIATNLFGDFKAGMKVREVFKVQSNSIAFKCSNDVISWLDYPKAKDFKAINNGFEILEKGIAVLRYEFI